MNGIIEGERCKGIGMIAGEPAKRAGKLVCAGGEGRGQVIQVAVLGALHGCGQAHAESARAAAAGIGIARLGEQAQ